MSSKRIQKRLDQLFTDIKQSEEPTFQVQVTAPTAPEAGGELARITQEQKPVPVQPKQPKGKNLRTEMGTRMLGPEPHLIAQQMQLSEPGTITLPFRSDTNTWSVLEVSSPPPEKRRWSEDEQLLVQQVTDQLSLALENARLLHETQQRNTELATLNEIIGSASQTLELNEILNIVLERAIEAVGFDGGLITMYNPARNKLERAARIGLPGRMPDDPAEGMEKSLCAVVFSQKSSLILEDFRNGGPVDLTGEMENGFFSYLGIPIESKGNVLGTLCGFRKTAGAFDENVLPLLQTISRQLGFAIENARLFEQTQSSELTLRRQNEYLATSAEIGRLVTSTLDMDTLFSRTVNLIKDRFGFYHAAIFTIEETGFNAVLKSATGKVGEEMLQRHHALPVGSRSIVGTASSTGNPLVVNNTATDSIFRPNPLSAGNQIRSGHSAPDW